MKALHWSMLRRRTAARKDMPCTYRRGGEECRGEGEDKGEGEGRRGRKGRRGGREGRRDSLSRVR